MPLFDDEPVKKKVVHTLGEDLTTLSEDELAARVALLAAEIERLEEAKRERHATREAASTFFKN